MDLVKISCWMDRKSVIQAKKLAKELGISFSDLLRMALNKELKNITRSSA